MIEFLILGAVALAGIGIGWYTRGTERVLEPDVTEQLPPQIVGTAGSVEFEVLSGGAPYQGYSGGDARRTIEVLNSQGISWAATRDGVLWDWSAR